MAEPIEFTGRSVQKAVEKASEALNTDPEGLEYDVISRGTGGFFGFGGLRKAKIRVLRTRTRQSDPPEDTPAPEAPEAEASRETPFPDFDDELDDTYERLAAAEKVLRRIVGAISPGTTMNVERNGTCVKFQLNGGNAGMLIGKRGQTLEAMQTLVEKCVNRTGGRRIHVAVDVETYLENRRAGIVRNAKRFAEKVKKNRKPISMGYMNAQDRRTVHLALKDDAGISTQSKGEGYLKKLKIYPRRPAPND